MPDALKDAGKNVSQPIGRAWNRVSAGRRELSSRGDALTHFAHSDAISPAVRGDLRAQPALTPAADAERPARRAAATFTLTMKRPRTAP